MKHEEIKLRMKVVPLSKKAQGRSMGLETSVVWKFAKNRNQPYLFVVFKSPNNSSYPEIGLSSVNNLSLGYDYFLASDVSLYEFEKNKS